MVFVKMAAYDVIRGQYVDEKKFAEILTEVKSRDFDSLWAKMVT
mgnify:CR=1 FL=1